VADQSSPTKQILSLDAVGTVAMAEQPCSRRVGFPSEVKYALNEGHRALVRLNRTLKSLTEITPDSRVADRGQVEDLKAAAKALRGAGLESGRETGRILNGPCYVFDDPSGKRFGFEIVRQKPFQRNHNGSSLRRFRKTSISFMVWTSWVRSPTTTPWPRTSAASCRRPASRRDLPSSR